MQSIYHINQPQWVHQDHPFRPKTAPARGRIRKIELREPSIDYFEQKQIREVEESKNADVEESSEVEVYY